MVPIRSSNLEARIWFEFGEEEEEKKKKEEEEEEEKEQKKWTGGGNKMEWMRRFHTIAYLQQIWWLEVDGNLEFEFPSGTYSLYFRLQLGRPTKRLSRRVCNLDKIHGWDIKPVRFQFSMSNGQHAMSQCYLNEPGKWVNYHVGDFVVEKPNIATKIKFSMTQIDCTHTKGGLCVDSVLILPKAKG
ncbi:hypothetical protein TEA_023397 [Camellia sinensis var. sinensis]|uniref:Uncharacterized protein n=1 Tax=Camellia sinensis var. sinensis TaxID=542762 RepID=A0A4S4E6T2_CAMSN|nr:hypothetical protein TEA_023397 [Camellia sinensis var. sinensis]